MVSNARRIFLFAIFSTAVAISSHLFFGSILANANSGVPEIVIKDEFSTTKDAHNVSGKFFAPSSCHDVTTRAQDMDAETVVIILETWKQPYRECPSVSTLQSFEVSFFAPEGIKIRTIIDGVFHPTRVLMEKK